MLILFQSVLLLFCVCLRQITTASHAHETNGRQCATNWNHISAPGQRQRAFVSYRRMIGNIQHIFAQFHTSVCCVKRVRRCATWNVRTRSDVYAPCDMYLYSFVDGALLCFCVCVWVYVRAYSHIYINIFRARLRFFHILYMKIHVCCIQCYTAEHIHERCRCESSRACCFFFSHSTANWANINHKQ